MQISVRKRVRARRSGQSLVEFAAILPILLLLVLGVVEFARVWNLLQIITDAGREGCRTMVVANPSITVDSVNLVINQALRRAGADSTRDTVTLTGFQAGTGTQATCRIAYPYQMRIIRGLMRWTNAQANLTLRTVVTMRNE